MFTQNWRAYWGLEKDPFACEDADKDLILANVDSAAVHSGFDRIFGDPSVPAPGIVFGEKGSGKSGLRLMMRRRIEEYNRRANGDGKKIFFVEYIDFDLALETFRQAAGIAARNGDPHAADDVANGMVEEWTIADHLDAILSLGVTKLVDLCLSGDKETRHAVRRLPRKERIDLALLTALYYRSQRATAAEALGRLRGLIGVPGVRAAAQILGGIAMTVVGGAIASLPYTSGDVQIPLDPRIFFAAGGLLIAISWLTVLASRARVRAMGRRAARSVRVLSRDARPVAQVLATLRAKERTDFALPHGLDDASRYDLLDRFLGLLGDVGYGGCYVLVDRVDEPSVLSGSDRRMSRFVERILDIKLLQYPRLALKLFLPIEMEALYRQASAEDLKRMRLDKSNLIPELKWTGEELYEIADQRLKACLTQDSRVKELADLLEEGFDRQYLRDTLTALGTPRYAFGFLSSAFTEYVRDLPGDLPPDDPRWRLSRAQFDVVRQGWLDKAGILRRSLN